MVLFIHFCSFLHIWLLLHKKMTSPHCAEAIHNTTFSGAGSNIQKRCKKGNDKSVLSSFAIPIIYILNENRVFALVLRLKTRHFHEHGE